MKRALIYIIITLLVLISFAGLYFAGRYLTGKAISSSQVVSSQFIFYKSLRVPINYKYSESCYPSGEIMEVIPGNRCCEDLTDISIIEESSEECLFVMGVSLCTDCGNSLCEYGENNCNCPEDCTIDQN